MAHTRMPRYSHLICERAEECVALLHLNDDDHLKSAARAAQTLFANAAVRDLI